MFKLRPYQQEAVAANRRLWSEGVRNPCTVLPTGAGKTIVASELIRQEQQAGGYFAAIAHRQELVGQISLALARQGVMHDIVAPRPVVRFCSNQHVEELGQSFYSPSAPGFVGGVDTVIRREMGRIKNVVSLLFQDECFPAGTLITMADGTQKPIEAVRVGDYVMAFDESDRTYATRRVETLYRNPAPKKLVRIETYSGIVLHCTANHPIWLSRSNMTGWRQAVQLIGGQIAAKRQELLIDGCWQRVKSARYVTHSHDTVYNFAVAGLHTYIANGVVVHNCHHVLRDNKWGKAAQLFPKANGLYVTATPLRADGKGLGRHADGLFDELIIGPSMRDLIRMGSLTDYRIFAPPTDIDLSNMVYGADGDYSRPELVKRAKKSGIIGDVVSNYEKYCENMQTVVFTVDVEQAHDIAKAFEARGIRAVALSANNTDKERQDAITAFRRKEIQVIVNVDLLGEGFDCPAIEAVIMARPTASYGLYCLSLDTEVLTPEGWVTFKDVHRVNSVYAYNLDDKTVSIQPVTGRVYREKYESEKMYGVSGPHLDIKVSDKHDMIVKGRSRSCKTWQKQKAEQVAKRKAIYHVPVAGFGKFEGSGLTKDELLLLGWYLADGTINPANNALIIGQAEHKTDHIAAIESAIRGCGFKYGKHRSRRTGDLAKYSDMIVFTISKGKPRGRDKHLTGWERLGPWLDKTIPPCYNKLTREELLILLESWNLGDGVNDHSSLDYVKRTLTITMGDNKHMGDRLQELCVVRGLRCNMALVRRPAPLHDLYNLHIRDCDTASIAGVNVKDGVISNKKQYKRSRFTKQEDAFSAVWCLTNPLGTLITRRNGKVAIVGNCQQFGRALRLLDGKLFGLIIDMVGNVKRHGLPDAPRQWSLDRREKRGKSDANDGAPVKTCPECMGVYQIGPTRCPYCGHVAIATGGRGELVVVDAELRELTPEELAQLRGEADKLTREWAIPHGASKSQAMAIYSHNKTVRAQAELRDAVALWAGALRASGFTDDAIHVMMHRTYGTNVSALQVMRPKEAGELKERIMNDLKMLGVA